MAYDFNSNGKTTHTLATGQKALTARTYHAAIKRDTAGSSNYGTVFTIETAGAVRRCLFANDNGDGGWGLVFRQNFSGGDYNWSVPYPGDTNWHYYTIVYAGTSTAPVIYKDGVSQTVITRTSGSGTLQTDDAVLIIGNRSTSGEGWDGGICELAIWNRQLTADEINALGKGFSPLFFRGGMVFHPDLIRNSNDLIMGSNGTDTNTTVIPHHKTIYPKSLFSTFVPASAGTIVLKTLDGLARASVKTFQGLASASTKAFNGLSNV